MCSHETKTQAHGQQIKSPAMCKTGHEHAANENTHKPLDMTTWKHAANEKHKLRATQHKTEHECTQPIKTRTACNNTKHVVRRVCDQANLRLHTHTTRHNMERECPNPVTKPKVKTWVLGFEQHAPKRNKVRRRESTRLKHTRSRALT